MDSLTYLQLLRRNRSFRRLWIGQVISELGNWFNFIAVLGLVRVVSNAAPEVTTIILIVRLAPFTIFAPLAGAFVDRWSRRTVMIVTDLLRVVIALGPLLVHSPEDLWIAYVCTGLLSFVGTFFEAAKNAAVPNITGERDLLAGNALMFSSRFLLMSLGAALGGWTAAKVGYSWAFVINAVSFLASAYSVWLVPEADTRQQPVEGAAVPETRSRYRGYWSDMREGWSYIVTHAPVATILGTNIVWAVGGGASNFIADRLGALVYAAARRNQSGFGCGCVVFCGGHGSVSRHDDRAPGRRVLSLEGNDDRLHRLEPVHPGNLLWRFGTDADVVGVVCIAGDLANVAGRGVCSSGNVADAFGAGQFARPRVDDGSRR